MLNEQLRAKPTTSALKALFSPALPRPFDPLASRRGIEKFKAALRKADPDVFTESTLKALFRTKP